MENISVRLASDINSRVVSSKSEDNIIATPKTEPGEGSTAATTTAEEAVVVRPSVVMSTSTANNNNQHQQDQQNIVYCNLNDLELGPGDNIGKYSLLFG